MNKVTDALLGVAIGDAVGVPYEFSSRHKMCSNPATDMIGYGTYNQPKGTWSDDSSLTFCLAEALLQDYNLVGISENFIKWKNESYWSARGEVFDIGTTTSIAIARLSRILSDNLLEDLHTQKHLGDEQENGNGSLMRILPLLFVIKGKPIAEQFETVWAVSALTHRHIRAAMSCMIYLKFAEKLLCRKSKEIAYSETRSEIEAFWNDMKFAMDERQHFSKIIQSDIRETALNDLKSGGYVLEVLESSFWFFLKSSSYKETILSIINIGHDTDTAAAIAGGLAGIYYGQQGMPEQWVASIARLQDILELGNKLNNFYCA